MKIEIDKEKIAKLLFEERGKIHAPYGWNNLPQFRKDRWLRKAQVIIKEITGGLNNGQT